MTDNPPNHRTADGRFNTGPGGSLDLDHVFTYHPPHGTQVQRYELLRDTARQFAELIAINVPGSPERTTALSRIREAVMWANAAIACNEQPRPPENSVSCPIDGCDWWVLTGIAAGEAAPLLHSHLINDHDSGPINVRIHDDGTVETRPLLSDGEGITLTEQPAEWTPTDPYAGLTVDVPTPSTQQAVCMITHEPPWCDGPCRMAKPVMQNPEQINTAPVLDLTADDPVAEARRYATAVEQWHASLPVTQSPRPRGPHGSLDPDPGPVKR